MAYQKEPGEGTAPLIHLSLMARTPERALALRLALMQAVRPACTVLDAGCGSLGVLAIMAAKLGAGRVVAVDYGRLDLARELAAENGVAGQIEFVQQDLTALDGSVGPFDVIIGMIYHNDPRRDLSQQQLMASLAGRLGRSGGAVIPGTVRYTAAGYDSGNADPTGQTWRADWDGQIGQIEGVTGITLGAARELVKAAEPAAGGSADPPASRILRAGRWPGPGRRVGHRRRPPWPPLGTRGVQFGTADRRQMTQLTECELFTEVHYASPETAVGYPAELGLTVTRPGRLDAVVWRQDLLFGDLLIRSTDTVYPASPPRLAQPGDVAVLSTGPPWAETLPVIVRQAG